MITLFATLLLQLAPMAVGDTRAFPTFDPTRTPADVVTLRPRGADTGAATFVVGADFVRSGDDVDVPAITVGERTRVFCFIPNPDRTYRAMPFADDGLNNSDVVKNSAIAWRAATRVRPSHPEHERSPAPEPPATNSMFTTRRPARVRLFQPTETGRIVVEPSGVEVSVVHVRPVDQHHFRVVSVDPATPDRPYRSPSSPSDHAYFVVENGAGSTYRVRVEPAPIELTTPWTVIATDDGETDSHWGQIGSSAERAVKELDVPSGDWSEACIVYRTGAAPYHYDIKEYATDERARRVDWGTIDLFVNDRRVAQRALPDGAQNGWHLVPIDPSALRPGRRNEISFSVSGKGMFYIGIDLDTDRGSSYTTTKGTRSNSLRPARPVGPGEYLVRLWVR